jgi:ketosteroid isomerase-like protein
MNAEATVRHFFDLLNAEDYDGLRALFTQDAAWLPQQKDMPGAGEYRGRDVVLDTFLIPIRKLFAGRDPQNQILSIASNGATVLVETHGTGTLADGRPYDNRYAWGIEVREGQIAEIREYMDSAYIVALFH